MKNHFVAVTLLAAIVASLANPVLAKTRYVEVYGNNLANTNPCTDKNAPCLTIGRAIDAASPNDTISVGPGTYAEAIKIEKDKIKLRSVAGAYATVIDASGSPSLIAIELIANKIIFGQKGKGFTVLAGSSTQDTLLSTGDANRIEGNRILSNEVDVSGVYALRVRGEKSVVRRNVVLSEGSDEYQYGIAADDGDDDGIAAKFLVSDNKVVGADTCMYIFGWTNNGSKTTNNQLGNCRSIGLYSLNADNDDAGVPALSSKDKHSGNTVKIGDSALDEVAGFYFFGGNPQISKNLADLTAIDNVADETSSGMWLEAMTKGMVKDNLVIGDGQTNTFGLWSYDIGPGGTPDITISGNTLVNLEYGVRVLPDDLKIFAKNNIVQIVFCPIFFDAPLAENFKMNKDFWGNSEGPDLMVCPDDTREAFLGTGASGAVLTINHATKQNPVKFKSPF